MFEHPKTNDSVVHPRSRPILVVAHPGHELRVHRWLEIARPNVWVITDGSGRTEHSRVDSTTRVLKAAGAVPGPVYGRMRDLDLYNAMLRGDHQPFTDVADLLAKALIRNDVDYIVGDAEEGYNPAHDACRLIINAAVTIVEQKSQRKLPNYDFTLVGAPGRCLIANQADVLWINLDEAAFARKVAAARNYPELKEEVEAALDSRKETFRKHSDLVARSRSTFGVTDANNFRVECLRPTSAASPNNGEPPFYEAYGEKQVSAGHYSNVLRYEEHMLPLAAALDSHVQRSR